MKSIVLVLLLLSSPLSATEWTLFLNWDIHDRPNTSIKNVRGELGEHLDVFTFEVTEVIVSQTLDGITQWWDFSDYSNNTSATHYSNTGLLHVQWATDDMSWYDPNQPVKVYIRQQGQDVGEWETTDDQYLSFWEIYDVPASPVPLDFGDITWDAED